MGRSPNIWRGKSWSKAKCCWAESDSQIVKRFIEFPSTRARHAHSLKNHAYIQPCITNIHRNGDLAILIISRRAVATSSSPGGYDVVGHGDHDDDLYVWRAVASSTSLGGHDVVGHDDDDDHDDHHDDHDDDPYEWGAVATSSSPGGHYSSRLIHPAPSSTQVCTEL